MPAKPPDWPRLIARVKACGWSQNDIAQAIGLAQTSVSDLERGKTVHPSWPAGNRLIHLADAARAGKLRAAKRCGKCA